MLVNGDRGTVYIKFTSPFLASAFISRNSVAAVVVQGDDRGRMAQPCRIPEHVPGVVRQAESMLKAVQSDELLDPPCLKISAPHQVEKFARVGRRDIAD